LNEGHLLIIIHKWHEELLLVLASIKVLQAAYELVHETAKHIHVKYQNK
jgi:hypothetical protein